MEKADHTEPSFKSYEFSTKRNRGLDMNPLTRLIIIGGGLALGLVAVGVIAVADQKRLRAVRAPSPRARIKIRAMGLPVRESG